jgi:hypothetical protein
MIQEILFKYHLSSLKPKIKKAQSHSLNDEQTRISESILSLKNRDLVLLRTVSSCLNVFVYQSRPCLAEVSTFKLKRMTVKDSATFVSYEL